MKRINILSAVFGAIGLILAVSTVVLSLSVLDAPTVLVSVPEAAVQRTTDLMAAVSAGDFGEVEKMLYGTPDLGMDREAADDVGKLIWDAFLDSIDYEFAGEFYATDVGFARNVTITTLELTSVTETLKERSQELLEKRVETAEDVSQVYDENNDYREDFVMDVLFDAVYQSLEEDARYRSWDVTLNLVYHQDQWWIRPDQTLIAAISGGTAG